MIVELIVALSLFILLAVSGGLAGVDSRDGSDWRIRKEELG